MLSHVPAQNQTPFLRDSSTLMKQHDVLTYAVARFIVRLFVLFSPSASAGGDHIKWRRSASDPPRAALQEEGKPGEGGQPGIRPREAGGTLKEQETREVLQKGQRQTRPQAKGQSARQSGDREVHTHTQFRSTAGQTCALCNYM